MDTTAIKIVAAVLLGAIVCGFVFTLSLEPYWWR